MVKIERSPAHSAPGPVSLVVDPVECDRDWCGAAASKGSPRVQLETLMKMAVAMCAFGITGTALAQGAVQWPVSAGGNGHWYEGVVLGVNPVSWHTARAAAHARGAELAQLKSPGAVAWVFANVANAPALWRWKIGPWLGGYQLEGSIEPGGGWIWIDGTAVDMSTSAWEVGEPRDYLPCGDHENYLNFYNASSFAPYPTPSPVALFNDMPATGLCVCCNNQALGLWVASAIFEWSADCNSDGVVDYGQIRSGQLEDVNADGVPDICQSPFERHVPAQYPTIQAAVDASQDTDVVRIAPGVYNEAVRIEGKSVTLRGNPGFASVTVINAAGVGPYAVSYTPPTDGTYCGISDLTLTHSGLAVDRGVGLFYQGGGSTPARFERCILRDNVSTGIYGSGGAEMFGNAVFERCAFVSNRPGLHGAAIYAYDGVTVNVLNCSLRDHPSGTGLFYARTLARVTVSDSVISGSNVLCTNFDGGTTTFLNNQGCSISNIGGGGFVNGGGNIWNSCPDCDGDGIPNLEEIIFGAADCNDNGLPDSCEIAQGSPDINGNGVLDQCECPSDINASGAVDGGDLAILLSAWGPVKPGHVADIVSDGVVNGADLAIMLGEWGVCD